jgi:hypothetical protein
MVIGAELDKQIYKEGESTWGLKSGFLDVGDVKQFIKDLKENFLNSSAISYWQLLELEDIIDELAGKELITK